MSIIPLSLDNFENYVIKTHTHRTFSSSSEGLVGELKIFPRGSEIEKDTVPAGDGTQAPAGKLDFEASYSEMLGRVHGSVSTDTTGLISQYINNVEGTIASTTRQKRVGVIRFEPSSRFTKDTGRKNTIKNILFPFYSNLYTSCEWAYPNYHSINFFTSSDVPSTSVLIYPAASGTAKPITPTADNPEGFPYSPHDAFTFEFWINPRYTTDNSSAIYRPGTILHLSSSYAISLVPGSAVDLNGRPDGFRIMLQLSDSAGIPPSQVDLSDPHSTSYGNSAANLIFLSSDNSLRKNCWHHVAIRWGGKNINAGTGSFVIDGTIDNQFCIPSASVMPMSFEPPFSDPDGLFVGNFFEQKADSAIVARFFNANVAYTDGIVSLFPGTLPNFASDGPDYTDPAEATFGFEHPLNAEIHEIKIYNSHKSIDEIVTGSANGIKTITDDLLFYLPPYFTKNTNERNVLQTPFQAVRSTTNDPFNVALSFGIGGREINLPNFLREFVQGTHPRLYHLTASEVSIPVNDPRSANDILYDNKGLRKGNLTILPNDNGQFYPDYTLLADDPTNADRFINRFGEADYSLISLVDMVSMTNIPSGTSTDDDGGGYLLKAVASPEDPGLAPGNILTILNRTRDPSSNEVVFFDASNLYYGNAIRHSSYVLTDTALTGSGGKVSIQLKDNGLGGLYRSDCLTVQAKWNEIGTLLYSEGIATVKTPNIPFFGKTQWSVDFEGDYSVHVLEINIPCSKGMMNSSSNPNWVQLAPSDNANITEDRFNYITGLNLHDENFNVVARMNLAQPVVKKESDRFLFRVKIDF
jgi:hypothetical protein